MDDIVDKILYWAEWSDVNCNISTDFSSGLSDDLRNIVSEIENLRDEVKNLKNAGNAMYNAICKHKNLLLTDNFSLSVQSWENVNNISNTIGD